MTNLDSFTWLRKGLKSATPSGATLRHVTHIGHVGETTTVSGNWKRRDLSLFGLFLIFGGRLRATASQLLTGALVNPIATRKAASNNHSFTQPYLALKGHGSSWHLQTSLQHLAMSRAATSGDPARRALETFLVFLTRRDLSSGGFQYRRYPTLTHIHRWCVIAMD